MDKNRRWCVNSTTFKQLPKSLTDCHVKRDFDCKSPSAQFEEEGKISWTVLGVGRVFLEPSTSAATKCPCKPLTIMCCHQRGPRKTHITIMCCHQRRPGKMHITIMCCYQRRPRKMHIMYFPLLPVEAAP